MQEPTVIRMMSGGGSTPEVAPQQPATMSGDAINFYENAMDQLDRHVLVGEEAAKTAVLLGLVLRKNVVLSGLPGGGKSTLANSIYRLIDGVDAEDVVMIPGQHDLTATQLVGGEIVNEKTVESEDESRTERNTHHIRGMIQPGTKVLRLEEPNRAPAHALQSILPVLENRRMETSAGWVELSDMLTVVASMNPSESRESTFKISNAMASRFTIGAEMGVQDEDTRLAVQKAVRKFRGNPENVEAVTSVEQLEGLRQHALTAAVPGSVGDMIDYVTILTSEELKKNRVIETDRRIGEQILTNAQALASLKTADNVVNPDIVNDAVHYVVAARIGALSTRGTKSAEAIANAVMDDFR